MKSTSPCNLIWVHRQLPLTVGYHLQEKLHQMKILILLLASFGATYGQVEPYGTEICRLFADGVKLREPGNCDSYITCNNGVGTVSKCDKSYDKEGKKCITKEPSDAYCTQPCTAKSPKWVADPKSCSGYYKCNNGKGTAGECGNGLHFSEEKQSCVYREDSLCKGFEYCGVVPNNVPFKNEATCDSYYMCVKNKLTEVFCEGGYYDAQKGCVRSSLVECEKHPVPFQVCGTEKRPLQEKFASDQRTCQGYYYCRDMGDHIPDVQPRWGECPMGLFFGYNEQACVYPTSVVCEDDRCEGRQRAKVISGTRGCQHYLICNNNKMVAEEKCPDEMYFNDEDMVCTAAVMRYPACL